MPQIIDKQPINRNFLSNLEFKFLLKRAPHVNFFVQKANIPQITLPEWRQGTPFVEIPYPGDHISFSPFIIEFLIDEQLENYREIQQWLYGLGFPQNLEQYAALDVKPIVSGEGIRSDIVLVVLNSARNASFEIVFYDCFPTSLSDLAFDTTMSETEYLSAIATFAYTYYEINVI